MKITDSVSEMSGVLAPADLRATPQEGKAVWSFSSDRAGAQVSTIPLWLWWNILSIDAPVVAVVWAALFARLSGIRFPVGEAAALALSVWIIYTSDRLLDGWHAGNRATLQARHLFCDRHRSALAALVIAAGALVLWLMADAAFLAEVRAGLKLGVILVLYMAGIHAGRARIARFLPKEISVGFLFALGVTLPIWSLSPRFPWHESLAWGFFGLLCSLNCLFIEHWENYREGLGWRQPPHRFVRWAGPRINLLAAAVVVGAFAACLAPLADLASQTALVAVGTGALLILFLNCAKARFSTPALRVLADIALLAPALIALLVRG